MRVTLDTNAIIDLEEERDGAAALRELIALHRAGAIKLCVSAIAAGEKSRDAEGDPNFAQYEARLAAVDLADVEELLPQFHWDLTFWDHCIFAELGEALEPAIADILFPGLAVYFQPLPGETDANRRRRTQAGQNRLCDVVTLWCHIRYRGDVLVTSDGNFFKPSKLPRLLGLGAGQILKPSDALAFIRRAIPTINSS